MADVGGEGLGVPAKEPVNEPAGSFLARRFEAEGT